MHLRIAAVPAVALCLAGCVSPMVKPNPLAFQAKAEHAHDWERLAERAVMALPSTQNHQIQRVYVEPAPGQSPFAIAYRAFLQTSLYRHNYTVMTTPRQAEIVLRYNVQVVDHKPGGNKPMYQYASLYTGSAAALGQFRNISSIDTGFAAGIVTGVAHDFLAAFDGATDTEIVVSTTIEDGVHFNYLGSETLYVRPAERRLYGEPRFLPVVQLPVHGG